MVQVSSVFFTGALSVIPLRIPSHASSSSECSLPRCVLTHFTTLLRLQLLSIDISREGTSGGPHGCVPVRAGGSRVVLSAFPPALNWGLWCTWSPEVFLPAVAHVLLCERQRRGDDSQVLHWRARVSWGAFLAVVVVDSRTPVSSLCFLFWPVTRRCHGLRVWPWRPRCLGVERRPSALKNGSRTVRATDED